MSELLKNPQILREIIMDHYQYPHNHELTHSDEYLSVHMASESCIDDIHVEAKFDANKVVDVRFDGVACTIGTASTSIMTDLVIGKTIEESREIIRNYLAMINHEEYDEDLLEEANVFQNTYKQANRIKCATIGWNGLKQMLDDLEK
jgi:nitrogen fixation NifU-like protein